jgi:hypothetical protein
MIDEEEEKELSEMTKAAIASMRTRSVTDQIVAGETYEGAKVLRSLGDVLGVQLHDNAARGLS